MDLESNVSHRHSKKNQGKDGRKYTSSRQHNYVQPGQKVPKHPPFGAFPLQMFGYPPMFSYPMMGGLPPATSMMMAATGGGGGINNLISNIKSLNIQMAAAIVNAEKMKRIND